MEMPLPSIEAKKWPPQQGWLFFTAWMAGAILISIVSVITYASTGHHRIYVALPVIAGNVWQGWLLFRRQPIRWSLWAMLPLLAPMVSYTMAAYLKLVFPFIEAAILWRVRQRVWAWILASLVGVATSVLFVRYLGPTSELAIKTTAKEIGVRFGLLNYIGHLGFVHGAHLLAEILCAAIIAWKMPLVNSRGSQQLASQANAR